MAAKVEARLPRLGEVTAEDVARFSQSMGEPLWLAQLRQAAWETFQELPVPDRSMETWNRLNLSNLPLLEFPAYTAAEGDELTAEVEEMLGAEGTSYALVQRDSSLIRRRLGPELEEKGVTFTDLHTASVEKETLVKKYLAQIISPREDKFTALSAALWSGGFFLHVPAGVEVEIPLQALRFRSRRGVSIARTLVILERDAQVTFVESQHGAEDPEEGLDVHGVELVVGPGARLRYVGLQNWDEKTWSFIHRRSLLMKDASMIWALGEFGGRVARSSLVSEHRGDGSSSRSYTVFFSSGRQHHDIFQVMYHTGNHTDANMDARGAAAGESRCVYRGDIEIERGTRDTSSFESMHGLVLDPGARIDSIPSLYIEDNDVRASHSATTGQVDPEQLFYLMSRGISYQEARRLIVEGFFSPILEEIPLESAREAFQKLIARKLGRA